MSGLGDALERVWGARAGAGFTDQLADLRAEHGGVTGLARHLGVHRTTVQRWQRGATAPKADTAGRIGREFRDRNTPGVRGDDGHGYASIIIGGTEAGGRVRQIHGSSMRMDPAAVANARATWVATGDIEAAALVLWKGIQDSFYKDFFSDGIEYEGYEPDLDSDYFASAIWVAL